MFDAQVRKVENRATAGALLLLRGKSTHPYYCELIDALGRIPGRIFQEDVINTLAHIVMQRKREARPSST